MSSSPAANENTEGCENLFSTTIERILLLLLFAGAVALTFFYVNEENCFYWSDYTLYEWIWKNSVGVVKQSPFGFLLLLGADTERSAYFAIPMLPAAFLFNESRLTFEIGLVVLYAVPYLVLTSIATSLMFEENRKKVFWIALSLNVLSPVFWAIPLRGYPEYFAGDLFLLALVLFWKDAKLKKPSSALLIGLLLGFVPLARRHYIYAAAAFVPAMFACSIAQTFNGKPRDYLQSAEFFRLLKNFAILCMYAGLSQILFGFEFFSKLLNFDYDKVFFAFHMSPYVVLEYFVGTFGWAILLMSIAGGFLIVRDKLLKKSALILLLSYMLVMGYFWFFKVGFAALHYMAHFNWLLSIGICALITRLVKRPVKKIPVVCALLVYLYLVLNLAQGLGVRLPLVPAPVKWGLLHLQEAGGNPFFGIFSCTNPPVRRDDLLTVEQLCNFLMANLDGKSTLCVAACSATFNDEMLLNALGHYAPKDRRADLPKIIKLPQIDYRDDLPEHVMASCQYFLVALPFQHCLIAENQSVLNFIVQSFEKGWGLSSDFELLPEKFELEHGVKVSIFKRKRSASLKTLSESVAKFQPFDRRPHLMANPWLVFKGAGELGQMSYARMRHHVPIVTFPQRKRTGHYEFVYLGLLDEAKTLKLRFVGSGSAKFTVEILNPRNESEKNVLKEFDLNQKNAELTIEVPASAGRLLAIETDVSGVSGGSFVELPELN